MTRLTRTGFPEAGGRWGGGAVGRPPGPPWWGGRWRPSRAPRWGAAGGGVWASRRVPPCRVDRVAPRKRLHAAALRLATPLLNGGTRPFSGHLEVYVPGETASFTCRCALDSLAAREAAAAAGPARCRDAPEPSIVTT